MLSYIVKRILVMVPVAIAAMTIVFLLMQLMPGDPVEKIVNLNGRRVPPAVRAATEKKYGLDDPVVVQYGRYLGNITDVQMPFKTRASIFPLYSFRSPWSPDFGQSYNGSREVTDILAERAPASLRLAFWAILIEILIGIGAGVLSAVKQYSFLDSVVTVSTTLTIAVPVFVSGFLLQFLFGVAPVKYYVNSYTLGLVAALVIATVGAVTVIRRWRRAKHADGAPSPWRAIRNPAIVTGVLAIAVFAIGVWYDSQHPGTNLLTKIQLPTQTIGPNAWVAWIIPSHGPFGSDPNAAQWEFLVLPAIVLASVSTALVARMQRTTMLETMRTDYVRTVRAKGLLERKVIWKHGLRNALLPVITLIGIDLGTTISSAVLTETVFSWPGLGSELVRSAHNYDVPVVLGLTTVAVVAYLIVNLLVDISYAYFDPRIRYGGDSE